MKRGYCPVCWQPVEVTGARKRIPVHLDSIGRDECPASSHTMRITLAERPSRGMTTASGVVGARRMRQLSGRLTA